MEKGVSVLVDSDDWDGEEAKKVHTQWVEEVANTMQYRLRDGFHLLRRNCQHVAAWTVNTIKLRESMNQEFPIEFTATPPNKIFRILSTDWLPEEMTEKDDADAKTSQTMALKKWMEKKKMILWPLLHYLRMVLTTNQGGSKSPAQIPSTSAILEAEGVGWMLVTHEPLESKKRVLTDDPAKEESKGVAKSSVSIP